MSKYLDTKEGSLEQSILGVWQTAIEEKDARVDGRTKQYKEHRAKLEAARLRREKKNLNKEEVKLQEKPDDFIRLTFNSPADVKKAKKWMDQNLPGADQGFTGMDASGKDIEFEDVDDAEDLMAKLKKAGFRFKMDYREEVKLKEGSKEEYQKFFNAAMKKFGIDSPADLKSDEEKKKFFDYVDKNYKGEKDEEVQKLRKELFGLEEGKLKDLMIKAKDIEAYAKKSGGVDKKDMMKVAAMLKKGDKEGAEKYASKLDTDPRDKLLHLMGLVDNPLMQGESYEIGTDKYRKHTEDITPGEDGEWVDAINKKNDSMREALAKVWGVSEGKSPFEKKSLTKEVKDGKTMTGKKIASVDINPTIKEKAK